MKRLIFLIVILSAGAAGLSAQALDQKAIVQSYVDSGETINELDLLRYLVGDAHDSIRSLQSFANNKELRAILDDKATLEYLASVEEYLQTLISVLDVSFITSTSLDPMIDLDVTLDSITELQTLMGE